MTGGPLNLFFSPSGQLLPFHLAFPKRNSGRCDFTSLFFPSRDTAYEKPSFYSVYLVILNAPHYIRSQSVLVSSCFGRPLSPQRRRFTSELSFPNPPFPPFRSCGWHDPRAGFFATFLPPLPSFSLPVFHKEPFNCTRIIQRYGSRLLTPVLFPLARNCSPRPLISLPRTPPPLSLFHFYKVEGKYNRLKKRQACLPGLLLSPL